MRTAKPASRREWGQGCIIQRTDRGPDVWTVVVNYRRDPMTGKRVRETRTLRGTERDAKRALDDMREQKKARGHVPSPSRGHQALDTWIREQITTGLSKQGKPLAPRTRAGQLDLWTRYSSPELRGVPLRDVSTDMLESHVARLRDLTSEHTGRPLAPRTVQLWFNVVRACLAAAVRKKVLHANPALGVAVEKGTATSRVGQALNPDEMERFLDHEPEDPLQTLWHVAAATGVRPGELLALRWEDFDPEAATLHVQRALVRVGTERYYAPCKAGSARVIPLAPELVAALKAHKKRQVAARLALGPERWVDPSLLFTNGIGDALDQHNVAHAFRARLKAAGVRQVRWYDLRHSYGSHLIAAGVDHKTVAELMGHKDVSLTLRQYVHPDEQGKRAALERLAAYRRPGKAKGGLGAR